jgi:hypothetical protein
MAFWSKHWKTSVADSNESELTFANDRRGSGAGGHFGGNFGGNSRSRIRVTPTRQNFGRG